MGTVTELKPPKATGNCFENSLIFAKQQIDVEKFDARLVRVCHGLPLSRHPEYNGERYAHSWVEITDADAEEKREQYRKSEVKEIRMMASFVDDVVCFDVTTAKLFRDPLTCTRVGYYGLGHIESQDVRRYSLAEAIGWMEKTGHCGPWESPSIDVRA